MVNVKLFLFFLVCLTGKHFEVFSKQLETMLSSVKVSSISDDDLFYKKVNISETEESTIYMYYSADKAHIKPLDLELNVLYIYVNCKFSNWTTYELYNFVNKFPSFYFNKFPNDSIENSTFSTEFEKLKENLENILIHIERFVNELNTFIIKKPKFSYYSDKSILDELLLLKLKLHFIITNRNLSDNIIIGMVLGTMNAIQRFLTLHCNDSPSNYEDPHFYGYSIVKNNSEADISNFLQLIEKDDVKFNPKSQTTCTIDQILLATIAKTIFDDAPIQAEVSSTVTKSILIFNDYLIEVQESYDIESISRYQRTVLNGIIQLIYTLIIILNDKSKIDTNLNELCAPFIEKLKKIEDVPKDFIICINELSNLFDETAVKKDIIENINNNIESLNSKMKLGYTTPKIHDVQNKLIATLEVISSNIEEFQCFNQYFKRLHDEHKNGHYNPFTKNTKIIETETEDKFYMESFCDFTKNIYKICFEITVLNNKGASSEMKYSSLNLYNEVGKNFQEIKEFLFGLIRRIGTENLELLKTASNIVIILENRVDYSRDISSNINRLAHIVMNELDRYGIKYCKPANYNFLHINNIYYSEFGDKKIITSDIKKYLPGRPGTKYNYDHYNLSFLCNNYVYVSVVFNNYKDLIMVYWKGERINIEQFGIIQQSFTLNPDLLYAFYDIYFKYYVAAYFYEIRKLWNLIENDSYKCVDHITTVFDEEEFPVGLRSFIVKIKDLEKLLVTIKEDDHKLVSKVKHLLQNIGLQFDEFGFDFVYESKQNEACAKDNLTKISSEISTKVNKFNKKYYLLLINPKPQKIVEDST